MQKLRYERMRLVVGDNEIKVFNLDDGSLITILESVTNETMEECVSSITELLSYMGVKFRLNDDYYYKNYGKRLIPVIRSEVAK